ncbi:MAG: NAD(P)(+) transhydrogenase (Re/Si-specific) subunit beta, partial [Gemmatimonadetes bacterium]|nr:NAD(P)(+) transhydrogenase (Re/Si-specific) subunit beta [Gemmatimonadota bacterium]
MTAITELVYLAAAVLFILGLKRLASPATARGGNLLSAVGMLLAIAITLLDRQILSFQWIIIGMVVGAGVGAWMARAVAMTAMPQMVGLFNGFGGGASVLVAAGEWNRLVQPGATLDPATAVTVYASARIGSITFSGSVVAAGKLQELISGRPVLFRGQHGLNLLLVLGVVGLAIYLSAVAEVPAVFLALIAIALLLGVLLTIPIGGADMPVVIC